MYDRNCWNKTPLIQILREWHKRRQIRKNYTDTDGDPRNPLKRSVISLGK